MGSQDWHNGYHRGASPVDNAAPRSVDDWERAVERAAAAGSDCAANLLIDTRGAPAPGSTELHLVTSIPESLREDGLGFVFSAGYWAFLVGFFEKEREKMAARIEALERSSCGMTTEEITDKLNRTMAAKEVERTAPRPVSRAGRPSPVSHVNGLSPHEWPSNEAEFARHTRAKLIHAHAIVDACEVRGTHTLCLDFTGNQLGDIRIQGHHGGHDPTSKVSFMGMPEIGSMLRRALAAALRAEIEALAGV